jgi:high-affinity iron transporter
VALQLVVAGLHELSESGVIASSKREMAIIGPIVRNDLFFFVTIVALAALMVLFDAKRRQPVPGPASAAERRKAAWTARKERLWMASVYGFSFLFIALVTAEFIYAKSVSALSPATEVSFVNGQVQIALAQVSDGDLHRYQAQENGSMRSPTARSLRFSMLAKSAARSVSTSRATWWFARTAPRRSIRSRWARRADATRCR